MALSEQNVITAGIYGRIGNLIFRRWNNKSVVSAAPNYSKRKWSKAQTDNRMRFRDAMAFAKEAMKDPVKRAYYRKKAKQMQTAWNVAVQEYMMKPEINDIDISGYKGRKGNMVLVKMRNDFRVAAAIITILSAQGIVIESGQAVRIPGSSTWVYKSRESNPSPEGGRVVVRVGDVRGLTTQTYWVLFKCKV